MATDTPFLELRRMDEGQATAEVLHNESVNFIDALMRKAVISVLSTPPGGPSEGDVYLVGAGASGVWSGEDDSIAFFFADWFFFTPTEGWTIWINNVNDRLVFDGAAWVGAVTVNNLTDDSGGSSGGDTIAAVLVAITDPADTPADADALRDDLVINTIPDIETGLTDCANAIATLAAKVNALQTELRVKHGLIN